MYKYSFFRTNLGHETPFPTLVSKVSCVFAGMAVERVHLKLIKEFPVCFSLLTPKVNEF